MSDNQILEVLVEPIESVVIPEVEEKIYTYQPKDEEGRPIGGKQVIKYRTQDELTDKFSEQNTLLIRKLREETRKNRLGILENEEIAPEATRFSGPVSFTPRQLTNDERYQISLDLMDPEKQVEAQAKLIEASIGARPDVIGATLRDLQEENLKNRAIAEANAFTAETPEYYLCQKNYESLVSWMVRYDLAPVRDNFRRAYEALSTQNLLILAPESAPIQVAEPVVVSQIVETIPAVLPDYTPRLSSGLTRETTSDTTPTKVLGDDIVYDQVRNGQTIRHTGMAAVNAMSSDEYGRRVKRDPGFAKKVDKLAFEIQKARQGRE